MAASASSSAHRWKFVRIGGLDQVVLESGEDLRALHQLDQKLWIALSCPVRGLELDERTLELLDTDKNGRIRVPEILAAIDWCSTRLKNLDDLLRPGPALPLSSLQDQTPEGKTLLSSARQILTSLGKPDSDSISVADTSDTKRVFENTRFNGDGVITLQATDDLALRAVIDDIIRLYGADTDRGGRPGVTAAKVDQFFADIAAYHEWTALGATPEVRVAGDATALAQAATGAVRAKIDDYFARCSLAAFDPRSLNALNRQESEYLVVATKELTLTSAEMSAFPLARIEAGRPLPLVEGLNPAWSGAIADFRRRAVAPFFGADKTTLSGEEWTILQSKLAAFEKWQTGRKPTAVDALPAARLQQLATSDARTALHALLAEDKALQPQADAIADVERLTRYVRDFATLLRNFVNFTDFYDPARLAAFQAGTLYLDSRSTELCVRVDDPASHSALASLSRCYIAYCDLKRVGSESMKIAACFTQGDSDYLMVGRNGLFYDRKGRDWDATITKIIDNPISIRQAFWSPYKKFVRMIEEQVAKRASAADAKVDAKLAGAAATTAHVGAEKPKPAEPRRVDVGTVAALGVGLGALTTAFGYFLGFFKGMPWWQVPLVFVAVMLIISLPSMAIAWLKLRQRTLGPILDANGWAVNGRVKINIPFGASLTRSARLPRGSRHVLADPFADKAAARRRSLALAVVIVAALAYGYYAHQHKKWPFEEQPAPQEQPSPDKVENKTG